MGQLLRHHRHLFVFRPQRGLRPLPFQDLQAQLSRMLLDGPDRAPARKHQCSGQTFLQLAHVQRPWAKKERTHRVGCERDVRTSCELAKESANEKPEILAAFAQRRQ